VLRGLVFESLVILSALWLWQPTPSHPTVTGRPRVPLLQIAKQHAGDRIPVKDRREEEARAGRRREFVERELDRASRGLAAVLKNHIRAGY
jgi:hypothetical protein